MNIGNKNQALVVLLAGLLAPSAQAQLPVTGLPVAELSWVDDQMQDYMDDNNIRGAVLGIMRNGCIIYQRGFGYHDQAETIAMPENSLFRIASCTKPVTAAAIQALIADGTLNAGDFVFELGQGGGGILPNNPFPAIGDNRHDDITVQHCLTHAGGWDRSITADLTYRECQIASAMGVGSPPGRTNTMNWILGQPLEFTPGSQQQYSNVGYLMLGLVVENQSGMSYINFVRNRILTPDMWVPATDIRGGRTFAENQPFRETWYQSTSNVVCVFPRGDEPACDDNAVPRSYGGYDHEARISQGGLVVSAATMLRFLDTYQVQVFSANIGVPLAGTPVNGSHNGGFTNAGVNTFMRQRNDGINYFVFFNHDDPNGNHGNNFDAILNPLLTAQATWPAECVDGFWVHPTYESEEVYGSLNRPFSDLDQALPELSHGSRVNFWPGTSDWSGTITTKLMLRAPLGTIRIGE